MLLHNFSQKYRTYVSRHVPHGCVVLCILCILYYFSYHACIHGFRFEAKFMETKFLGFEFCISRWSKYILPWDVIFKLWYIWMRKEMLIRLLKFIHQHPVVAVWCFFYIKIINEITELINSLHEFVAMIFKVLWKVYSSRHFDYASREIFSKHFCFLNERWKCFELRLIRIWWSECWNLRYTQKNTVVNSIPFGGVTCFYAESMLWQGRSDLKPYRG